ncbi:bifunctional 3-(3-hydroxy-phenyl)propionate/3-hydroxycinnamic acid hydroxylase MhpA [Hamadaea tsunoensis]|uniref:bifunctional 3-(3-hydroxy-phenyl)propionate/3-hydroxycinnamic acid hydroxylase MhpA n=1 Tax=Hamadaea tsunoensis TaxID=53368 RepID=UPI00040D1AD4|nr:bifunctional 3-(3-hydroxy-phenyl)propionate/3-hydroxycinnamic acid hydroxylase [Hamadaea tsunoensis]
MDDVLIVGYGPVGQTLAVLLGQQGWRVRVVERWPRPYPMPRAVAFDTEGARILASAGVAGIIGEIGEPSHDYTFVNAAGDKLLEIDVNEVGRCLWPDSTSMYQPALEAALIERGAALPTVEVMRGFEVVELTDHSDLAGRVDGVTVVAAAVDGERRTWTARWVVGCDGANSFVRERIGTSLTDLGFSHDWLICDVALAEPVPFRPNNLQVCDPARPRTAVSAGPGHRRWEFMRVDGESVEDLYSAEAAWQLLALFDVDPDHATLERFHVYSFTARYANEWRSGRLLLAGDAAHVMPPFAGQGMCSGLRDAASLAWRLDLLLRGVAGEALLDGYVTERRQHVRHALSMSVNLGKVICQTDPRAAADRDTVMIAARQRPVAAAAQQRSPVHPLQTGLLHAPAGTPIAPAGLLMPQGNVGRGSRTGTFDEIAGRGFVLLTTPDAPVDRSALDPVGGQVVTVLPADSPAGDGEVADTDGVYTAFFAEHGVRAVLVRPDFYVYGGAADPAAVRALVAELLSGVLAELPVATG